MKNKFDFKKYELICLRFQAIRYEGKKMDKNLIKQFPNDFRLAYGFAGDQELAPIRRGLKIPQTNDWFLFDEEGKALVDITTEDLFHKTYKEAKEESVTVSPS